MKKARNKKGGLKRKFTPISKKYERKNLLIILILFLGLIITVPYILQRQEIRQEAAATAFRFGSTSDVEAGYSLLAANSNQMKTLNPIFQFFPGDTCDPKPISGCWGTFKSALDGNNGNGMAQKWFITRGNHEWDATSFWPSAGDWSAMATRVGATNYSGDSFSYSFDYSNAHFVVLDWPSGGTSAASTITSAELSWLDADLSSAESRGLQHAFIFFHGLIYPVSTTYCCTAATNVTAVLTKHPIVSATFHGHEHLLSYTHIDSSKISNVSRPFEQFGEGGGGDSLYSCSSGRADWCQNVHGFAMVDVNGSNFTVNFYQLGTTTPIKSFSFTKAGGTSIPPVSAQPTAPQVITPTFYCAGGINCATSTTPTQPTQPTEVVSTAPSATPTQPTNTPQPTQPVEVVSASPTQVVTPQPSEQLTPTPIVTQPNNYKNNGNNSLLNSFINFILQIIMLFLSLLGLSNNK